MLGSLLLLLYTELGETLLSLSLLLFTKSITSPFGGEGE